MLSEEDNGNFEVSLVSAPDEKTNDQVYVERPDGTRFSTMRLYSDLAATRC
jgi:hypothetical protein